MFDFRPGGHDTADTSQRPHRHQDEKAADCTDEEQGAFETKFNSKTVSHAIIKCPLGPSHQADGRDPERHQDSKALRLGELLRKEGRSQFPCNTI